MPKINDEQKQLRKEQIRDHAFEVFSEKGYANSSIDDIVKHSGISKGGIYLYFKSKEEIFFSLADRCFQNRHFIIDWDIARQDPLSQLKKYIDTTFLNLENPNAQKGVRFMLEFWNIQSRTKEVSPAAAIRYTQFSEDLIRLFRIGILTGKFKSNLNAEALTFFIISSLDGISTVNAVMGIPIPPSTKELFYEMLLKIIQ